MNSLASRTLLDALFAALAREQDSCNCHCLFFTQQRRSSVVGTFHGPVTLVNVLQTSTIARRICVSACGVCAAAHLRGADVPRTQPVMATSRTD